MIDAATVEAHHEAEQMIGWFTIIGEHLEVPFVTSVLESSVVVERVDVDRDERIVAICRRGRKRHRLPVLDLPLPTPAPAGAEWL
jgi:hypothetical protein